MFKRVFRRPARVVVQVNGIIYAYNKMEAGSRYEIHFEIGGFDNLQVRPLNLPQQRVSVVIEAHPTKLNGVNGVRGVWSNVDHTIRVRRDKYGTRVDRSRYRDNRPR